MSCLEFLQSSVVGHELHEECYQSVSSRETELVSTHGERNFEIWVCGDWQIQNWRAGWKFRLGLILQSGGRNLYVGSSGPISVLPLEEELLLLWETSILVLKAFN